MKWFSKSLIQSCVMVMMAILFFILSYQFNLAKPSNKQIEPLLLTQQPDLVEGNPILYTTLLEDFTRTIVVLDPTALTDTVRLLNPNLTNISHPVWSHSHEEILYAIQEDESKYSFGIVNYEGKNLRQLIKSLPFEASVNGTWAFDDQYVAFHTSSDRYALSTHALIVTKVENNKSENKSQELMSDGVWIYDWSPIDYRLAVVRWASSAEASGLYLLDIDGSQKDFFPASTFFSRAVPTLIGLSWSPDGQHIAITNTPDKMNPTTGELTQVKEVYVINVETRTVEQFTNQQANLIERSISCLKWSPHGRKIFFVSDYRTSNGQSRQGALIVVDVESRAEIQLANYVVTWACPAWSSDGEEIAFISIDNPQNVNGDIYAAEVETYTVRRLTNDKRAKNGLSW